jgi:hypothetical protein
MVPATGNGFTVIAHTAVEVPQMLVTAYFIVSTPAPTPVTTPEVPTVAIAVKRLDHIPPATLSESVTDESAHTDVGPDMLPAIGIAFTVKLVVAKQPVGSV